MKNNKLNTNREHHPASSNHSNTPRPEHGNPAL